MKLWIQEEQKHFARALIIFLIGITAMLVVFFAAERRMVEQHTEAAISINTERQSHLLRMILETNYGYLEAAACQLAEEEDIRSAANLHRIGKIQYHSELNYLLIADAEGNAVYVDESETSIADRRYFREAMSGMRTLSDPVVSKLDGVNRVVLGVPIIRDERIIGILGGSIEADSVSEMLFKDVYGGRGISMLVTKDGHVISSAKSDLQEGLTSGDDFFGHYSDRRVERNSSWERIRADFEQQNQAAVKIWSEGRPNEKWYLSYRPIEMNGWMMCYLIPEASARENYEFISRHEGYLSIAMILLIVVFLLELLRISEKHQRRLLQAAQTDALTQTLNKMATQMQVESWLEKHSGDGLHAFLIMDIDKFKEINDTYGHFVGDELLTQVGAVLKKHFRSDDIVGRIGGDEFVVFMKNVGTKEHVIGRVEELLRTFREIRLDDVDLTVTSSMGLVFAPDNGKTYLELYKAADVALYQQKAHGRNGYTMG